MQLMEPFIFICWSEQGWVKNSVLVLEQCMVYRKLLSKMKMTKVSTFKTGTKQIFVIFHFLHFELVFFPVEVPFELPFGRSGHKVGNCCLEQ